MSLLWHEVGRVYRLVCNGVRGRPSFHRYSRSCKKSSGTSSLKRGVVENYGTYPRQVPDFSFIK